MRKCSGAVVIALERSYFPAGFDKPGGPKEAPLSEIRLPTPWNQTEAAMAYASNLPLLVIAESGVRTEGLLASGYDWYVQHLAPASDSLSTTEFNGVLSSWKQKVKARTPAADSTLKAPSTGVDLGQMRIGELLRSLKPAQLWGLLTALAILVVGAFSLGAHLIGGK